MKKIDLSNVTRTFKKVGFSLKKSSPEILVVSGVVGTVAASVLACRATTKASEVLTELHDNMDKIHEVAESVDSETYSEEDLKKDTTLVYVQTGIKVAKLYAPAVILGAVSISSILKGHSILRKRNIALAAAYTAVDKGFKEYRSRVVERFGKDLDHELRYDIKAKEFTEVTVDKKGKEKTTKKTVNVANPNTYSEYARFFDEYCNGWTKDREFNVMFLNKQQKFATKKLETDGYLFLNDVYEMIGLPKTKAGQVVGWVYDAEHPIGDNYVDFGIYDVNKEVVRNFVNGYEQSILLDFNVDGNILDLM